MFFCLFVIFFHVFWDDFLVIFIEMLTCLDLLSAAADADAVSLSQAVAVVGVVF